MGGAAGNDGEVLRALPTNPVIFRPYPARFFGKDSVALLLAVLQDSWDGLREGAEQLLLNFPPGQHVDETHVAHHSPP